MATVLLTDDDELVRYALVRYLQNAGHSVIEASDGRRAEELLGSKAVDILVTDLIMPHQEGIETLINVQAKYPGLPVIAISGGGRSGDMNYLDAAKALGADRVFAKPIDEGLLVSAILELTNTERPSA